MFSLVSGGDNDFVSPYQPTVIVAYRETQFFLCCRLILSSSTSFGFLPAAEGRIKESAVYLDPYLLNPTKVVRPFRLSPENSGLHRPSLPGSF